MLGFRRSQNDGAANDIDQGDDDGTTQNYYHPGVTVVRITKLD